MYGRRVLRRARTRSIFDSGCIVTAARAGSCSAWYAALADIDRERGVSSSRIFPSTSLAKRAMLAPMSDEYRALVDKVGAFTRPALERRRADMLCTAGCAACCQVSLSVNQVEGAELRIGLAALPAATRAQVVKRGVRERRREASHAAAPRCAMLEPDGRCVVYAHRPLVCPQGFALRYPTG
jgi:hypothetical protein